MATESAIDDVFQGTDHALEFQITNAAGTVAYDASTWTLSWMLKKSKSHLDSAAKITKTSASGITVSGTFNSDPDLNAQLVFVQLTDTDTAALSAGTYFHELKRMNADNETILSYGEFELQPAVHKS